MTRRASNRKRGRGGRHEASVRGMWYEVGGVLVALVVLGVVASQLTTGSHHPEPRPELDHASHVVPSARYAAYSRVAETYELVAAVPELIDGIYCYCHCSEHSGHHSLLDCFASDHGARCDVCLSEATMAYRMSLDGHDLKAIRAEIDRRFRS